MDDPKLCMGCMQPKESDDNEPCPHCGYRVQQRNPMVLPYRYKLADKFSVGRILGNPGGFGVTYLAWDNVLHTTVAIKEYFPRHLANRDVDRSTIVLQSQKDAEQFHYGLQQFVTEARTLAKFSHPNIVRVREYFEQNNTAYLVMDYCEGISLDEFVQRKGGKISEHLAFNYILPILDGLRVIHEKKVLHRDIKPANIYITKDDVPILLDFGAARQAIGQKSQVMSVILTAGFAPFEQYLDEPGDLIGPWTDIYACGATLYAITTGIMPQNSLNRHQTDRLVSPIQIVPTLTPQFSRAIMAALTLDPEQRPQSVQAFQSLLLSSEPIFQPHSNYQSPSVSAQTSPLSATQHEQETVALNQAETKTFQSNVASQDQTVDKDSFNQTINKNSTATNSTATEIKPPVQKQKAETDSAKQMSYIRCPHCKSRNSIVPGQNVKKLHCQYCGKKIGLPPTGQSSASFGWKTVLAIPVLVIAAMVIVKNNKEKQPSTVDEPSTMTNNQKTPSPDSTLPEAKTSAALQSSSSTESTLNQSSSLITTEQLAPPVELPKPPKPENSSAFQFPPKAHHPPKPPAPPPESFENCRGKQKNDACYGPANIEGICQEYGNSLTCIPKGLPPPPPPF